MSPCLDLALNSGLSLSQPLTVLAPTAGHDISDLPRKTQMVQPFKPFHDHFAAQGFAATPESTAPCKDAIVFLPRASGVVVVDGAKTDGIDSLLKDMAQFTNGMFLSNQRGK